MKKRILIPRHRGAPLGNRNALKHGRYTRERRAIYAEVRAYIAKTRALTEELKAFDEERAHASQTTLSSPAEPAKRSDGKGTQVSTPVKFQRTCTASVLPHHQCDSTWVPVCLICGKMEVGGRPLGPRSAKTVKGLGPRPFVST